MTTHPRTRIKICGIKDAQAATVAANCGADAIGFMFASFSPRFVEPETAAEIMLALPPFVATVGVFVNPDLDQFCDIEEVCPTTYTQLHGNESEVDVQRFGPAIKAIRYQPDTIAADLARWGDNDHVDAILIDGSAGGEGVAFDWRGLRTQLAAAGFGENGPAREGGGNGGGKKIIIAGGLTPENVGEVIRTLRPYGVDISSGVEKSKGEKDPRLIAAFCAAVQRADAG